MPRKKIVLSSSDQPEDIFSAQENSSSAAPRKQPRRKKIKKQVAPLPIEETEAVDHYEVDREAGPALMPSPRFYRTIALSFLGVALFLVVFVLFFTSSRAEISLDLKPQTIKVETSLTVSVKGEAEQIPGLVLSAYVKGAKTFAASTWEEVPALASGKMIIYNRTKKDQPLVATTRLLSPQNVLFRLKKTVRVPAGGQIEAEVQADKSGLNGEIDPTRFSIPGLSEILQKDIYAESKAKMSGGMKRKFVVTSADLKRGEEILTEEIYNAAQNELSLKATASSSLSVAKTFALAEKTVKTETKAGAAAESFKLEIALKTIGVFYNPEDLNNALLKEADTLLSEGQTLGEAASAPHLETIKYNLEAKSAELKARQEFLVKVNFSDNLLDKTKILGQRKTSVIDYLTSLPWVDKVEVKIRPSWKDKIPSDAGKVEIKIDK